MQTASTFGTSISSTPWSTIQSAQPRQNRRRILHMLERVIHRHDVEAAGRECRILHEARGDRHPERLPRMARVLFVGFETGGVEAERPQHVNHLAAAGAGVENTIAALYIRCERAIAIQRAAARPGDMAHRRRGVPLVIEPVFTRVITPHFFFRLASDSTTRGRTCGKSSCAAGARRDRDRRSPRHRTRRRDCRGSGTQSRLETRTNCGSSDPSRKFFGLRSNIC